MKKVFFMATLSLSLLLSCSKPNDAKVVQTDDKTNTNQTASNDASSNVKAEDGGAGFEAVAEKLGYVTAVGKDYSNPNATKGGEFNTYLADYPNVLRYYGPNANSSQVYDVVGLIYVSHSSLVRYNVETNKWERGLANYWKFEPDGKTAYFRINPAVKFSDGSPFTVDDIIATHDLLLSEDLGDPIAAAVEKKFTMEKVSDYILKVTTQDDGWKNWIDLGGNMSGYTGVGYMPNSYLSKVDAKTFVTKYANETMPGLGPYTMDKEKSKDQELIVLKRNPNWWGYSYPELKNMFNFDTIQFKIIRESKMIKESFKKGDLDWYFEPSSNEWYEEFLKKDSTFDPLARNLMVKRVLFTGAAKYRLYFTFNTRKPPFDDIRLRKAISWAFDKDRVIDKMYRGDKVKYFSQNVFLPYASPNVEKYDYNPDKAAALLDEMGYNVMDSDGVRKNEKGERLEFEVLEYKQEDNEKAHVFFQEDMAKVGIKINLVVTDFPQMIKKWDDRDFFMGKFSLEMGSFPQYEGDLKSYLADQKGSNNIAGFKSEEADKLIDQFLVEKDVNKRLELSHKVDELASNSYSWLYLWVSPYTLRYMVWNKFGTATEYPDIRNSPYKYWYIDKDKDAQLQKAKTDTSVVMDEGELLVDPFKLKPADFTVKEY